MDAGIIGSVTAMTRYISSFGSLSATTHGRVVLRDLDPRRDILVVCRNGGGCTGPAKEHRRRRAGIWVWSGARGGSGRYGHVRCW